MFNSINYQRFSTSSTGFSSMKKEKPKSQRYMSVKTKIDLNEESPEFNDFNKIEFDKTDQEIHEIYDAKPTEFNNNNEMNNIEPMEEINLNDNIIKNLKEDILKKQSLLKFMTKSSKNINKYERKN